MKQLAINGGTKAITFPLKNYRTIGAEEKESVEHVIDTGILSAYLAGPGPDNYGGKFVRKFESAWLWGRLL